MGLVDLLLQQTKLLCHCFCPANILAGQATHKPVGKLDGGLRCVRFLLTTDFVGYGFLKVGRQCCQLFLEGLDNGIPVRFFKGSQARYLRQLSA